MPTKCEILINNQQINRFYAGDLLSGRVKLSIEKTKTTRGIYIQINGEGNCSWTDSRQYKDSSGNKKIKRTHYSANEFYLNERTYFLGTGREEFQLQPGVYDYTFQTQLPAGLPASIEGTVGNIQYTAKVIIDIPLWSDIEFEEIITVIKPLNLNNDPLLQYPIVREKRKTFFPYCFCFCIQSDPLFFIARIAHSAYAAGETIPVHIEMKNKSTEAIASVNVHLIKVIQYSAKTSLGVTSSKEVEEKIAESTGDGCALNESEERIVHLIVPEFTRATDVTTSEIIKIRYHLFVSGSVDGCHSDPQFTIPITIGTIPISGTNYANPSNWQQPPTAPLAEYTATQAPVVSFQPPYPINDSALFNPVNPSNIGFVVPYPLTNTMPMPHLPSSTAVSTEKDAPPSYEQAVANERS